MVEFDGDSYSVEFDEVRLVSAGKWNCGVLHSVSACLYANKGKSDNIEEQLILFYSVSLTVSVFLFVCLSLSLSLSLPLCVPTKINSPFLHIYCIITTTLTAHQYKWCTCNASELWAFCNIYKRNYRHEQLRFQISNLSPE